jgi:cysteine desulfurase
MNPVYLDYAATTPVDPIVLDKMLPYFNETFGNPSSIHRFGQRAEAALETAREDIAAILHCSPQEIFFTSGGTESDNLAVRGAAHLARNTNGANQIIITPVEHHAIEITARDLKRNYAYQVCEMPVDEYGKVIIDEFKKMLSSHTALVSVIYGNNEIGTVNPIGEIGSICHEKGILFHSDAVQAGGSLSLDVEKLNVDMLSLGAHKFYGPKGVGVLYIRAGTRLKPIQTGGPQERAIRAGTENIPLIVGMAAALKLSSERREKEVEHYRSLRDQIINTVLTNILGSRLTGHPTDRLPNHASFVFQKVDGNQLIILLDHAGFACSSGSACKTGSPEPSSVLLALGIDQKLALGSLRVTVGRYTTPVEVEQFLEVLPGLVEKASVVEGNRV